MYSGSTISPLSGRFLGAHQKLDRVARRNLERLLPGCAFPNVRRIMHFEGHNGPDAIKRKSPAKDEPWHYFQPFDEDDTQLLNLITDHYQLLVKALATQDNVRAAFEAAWLAHAIVDGLTPAHHYPYEEKLVELRGGKGLESRTTIKEKMVFPGETIRDQAANNWKFWGPKGLFTTHFAFEWGVSTLIAPLRLVQSMPDQADLQNFANLGIKRWFRLTAQQVADMKLYDAFYMRGWTTTLGRQVRRELAPALAKAISIAWYGAAVEAERLKAAA